MPSVPATHADLLERPLFASLATVSTDGSPLVNPMWFLWEPEAGVVKLTHTNRRHNYRCILREPRVSLSIFDPDDGYRYLQVRGVVTRIEPDPTGRFYQELEQRYFGHVSDVRDRDVRVVLFVEPTAYKVR